MPILLHGTPFKSLTSVNWTVEKLASKSKDIGYVLSKKSPSNIFRYYATEKPLSNLNFMTEEKDYTEVIFTAESFFNLLRAAFDGFYYYASGGVELLNLGDLGSSEDIKRMTFSSHLDTYSEHGQLNFWLGKENVTAHTHYDTSYNLHNVISGKKRFILFPPEAYSKLRLFPCLHQFYRQVSTNVLAVGDIRIFLRELGGFEVEMIDGDVLYIPPYWFHTVITVNTTISLNIWSQSEAYLTMEDIYISPIPFEAEWGRVKLMKALNYFILLLTEGVTSDYYSQISAEEFVLDRVYRRYEPLVEKKDLWLSKLRKTVQQYCLTGPISKLLDEDTLKHLEGGAQGIVEQFLGITPYSVREINLGNYIEHLVWRVLGDEDLVQLPIYLHECFKTGT